MPEDELKARYADLVKRAAEASASKFEYKPDYREQGLGQLIKGGFNRSMSGIGSAVTDVIPAMVGSALGYDDYAKEQMAEAAAKRQQAELENPTGFRSYKDVNGIGQGIGYAAETLGELGPDILGMLAPGGVGAAIGERVAMRGAAEAAGARAAESVGAKGLTGNAAEAYTKRLTDKAVNQAGRAGAETGLNTGMFAGAYGLNAPDTFEGIYEKTGEFRPELAAVFGAAQAALDTILPSYLLKQLSPAAKGKLASELVNRSSIVEPTIKMGIAKSASKAALGEGGTEMVQEALSILAERTAGAAGELFSTDNVDRLINAGLKGAIGGGVLGVPGGIREAYAERDAARAEIARREGLPPEAPPAAPAGPVDYDRPAVMRRPDYVARPGLRETPLPEADPNQLDMFPGEKARFSLDEVRAARIPEPGSSHVENLEVAKLKLGRGDELTNGEIQLLVDNKLVTPEEVKNLRRAEEETAPPEALPGQESLPGMSVPDLAYRDAVLGNTVTQPELPMAGSLTRQQTIGTPLPAPPQQARLFQPPPQPQQQEQAPPETGALPELDLQDGATKEELAAKNKFWNKVNATGQGMGAMQMPFPGMPVRKEDYDRPRSDLERAQPLLMVAKLKLSRDEALTNDEIQLLLDNNLVAPEDVKDLRRAEDSNRTAVITPAILADLGITPQMPAYKRTLNKNLDDPKEREQVAGAFRGLAKNKQVPEETRAKLTALLNNLVLAKDSELNFEAPATPATPNNPPSGTGAGVPSEPGTNATPGEPPSSTATGVGTTPSSTAPTEVGTAEQPGAVGTQPTPMDLGTALRGKPRSEAETNQAQEDLNKSLEETGEGTFRAAPGVDMTRMANLLGPQLYGNMSKISTVTVKEMFQNAFDAIKDALVKSNLSEGKINVKTDYFDRTITISDNGMGMTPEIISKAFLTIAGTHKESGRGSGGFGVAKMLFLFGNKNLKLETTRDGLTSTLETTGPELLAAFSDPSKAPNITTARTGKPSGTSITVTIPDTYLDEENQPKDISFGSEYIFKPILIKSPLLENVEVTYNDEVLPIGKNFPIKDFTVLTNVKFPWGNARILVKEGGEADYGGNNLIVLSQGLYQFGHTLKDGPGYDANRLPFTFFVNIEPTVAAENANYPFALNRQDFSPAQKPGVEKIFKYLQALYTNKTTAESAQSFGKLELLLSSGKPTSTTIDLAVPPAQKGTILEIDANDNVEVKDGKMYVNNRLVPELTPQALEAMRADPLQFKVDQKLINSNKILAHDNVDVREDYDDPDSDKVPFLERARRDLGADRVNKFIVGIGNVFKFLRNEAHGAGLKSYGNVNKYETITDVPVGVSFDTNYYGVSIRLPFSGMMINPTIIRGIDKEDTGSAAVRADAAATMVGTMVHEIAHHDERNHNESGFIPALQNLAVRLAISGSTQKAVADLIKIFSADVDVLTYFLGAGDGNLTNRGIKLEGAASERESEGGASVPQRSTRPSTSGGDGGVGPGVRQPTQTGNRPSAPSPKPAAAPTTPKPSTVAPAVGEINNAAIDPKGKSAIQLLDSFTQSLTKLPFITQQRADAINSFLQGAVDTTSRSFLLMSLPLNALAEVAERYLPGAKQIALLDRLKSGDEYARNKKIEPVVLAAEKWAKAFTKLVDAFNRTVYRSTIAGVDPSKPESFYYDKPGLPKLDKDGNDLSEAWRDLQADYKAIGPGGQKLYGMMRDTYASMYEEIKQAIVAKISATTDNKDLAKKISGEVLAKLAAKGGLDPYFPLTRYGNFWVSYSTKGGPKLGQADFYIRSFETDVERRRFVAALEATGEIAPRVKVDEETGKTTTEPPIQQFSQISEISYKNTPANSFVNGVLKVMEINKVDSDAKEQILRLFLSTLPETSFAQAFQKRGNVAGFEHDAIRALREKSFSMSRQLSNMKYAYQLISLRDELRKNVKAMGKGEGATDNRIAKEYYDEIDKRVKFIISPESSKLSQLLTSFGFNYLLGFNVSSAVINLTQVPLIVLPYLGGKYGFSETTKAIGNAYKVFANTGITTTSILEFKDENGKDVKVKSRAMPSIENLDPESDLGKHYKELINEGILQGQLNRSALYDILDVSGAKNPLTVANAASGWMFHHAERTNRQVALIAAYDLELSKIKNPTAQDKVAAAKNAIYVSELTNGGTTATSAPRIAQGSVGRVLFMFKRYGASMYYLLAKNFNEAIRAGQYELNGLKAELAATKDAKEIARLKKRIAEAEVTAKENRGIARRQLAATYGAAAVFSGLQGLPLFGVLAVIYNMFADDDDDDMATAVRKGTGEFFYSGLINALTNTSVASRVSLTNLLVRDNQMSSGSQTVAEAFGDLMGGPVYGIATKVERGLNQIRDGHIERGIENILPSALGNVLKGFRYATSGTTTLRGDAITGDVNPANAIAQAFGFAPADYTRQLEITAREKDMDKKATADRIKFLNNMYIAKRFNDQEGVADAREDLEKLYAKHPGFKKFGSLDETITRSMRQHALTTEQMKPFAGVTISKAMREEILQDMREFE
jgi:hypothetical protein